jgi:hypothetical protein
MLGGVWLGRQPGAANGPSVVTVPVPDTNPPAALIASNTAPPGLFAPPSLPVQPAQFKQ